MFNLTLLFMSYDFKYADLLDDDVFKLVFGRESTKDVMIEFLNQVIPDRHYPYTLNLRIDKLTHTTAISSWDNRD